MGLRAVPISWTLMRFKLTYVNTLKEYLTGLLRENPGKEESSGMWLLFLSPKRMRITSPNTHYLSLFLLVCRGRTVLSLISPEEKATRRGQGGARMRKHQSNGHPHTLQQWENTAVYWSFFSAYTALGVQHPHISGCYL